MEIYIEYVIIDNLVINALILLCVKNTLKLRSSWWRVLLSAGLGTLVAVLLPLISLPVWALFGSKIALGVFMVLILSRFFRLKDFVFAFLLFLAYTILLVGACLVTLLMFGTSLELLSQGAYDIAVPLGIVFAIVAVYVYFIVGLARYLSRKRELLPYLRKVQIFLGNKILEFQGFIDSGNKLFDNKTKLPVIILSVKGLEKYFSKEEIEKLMLEKTASENFKKVHLTSYNTISGEAKKMLVFEADKMVIFSGDKEYTTNRFVIGVSYKKFNDATNYDMLLNPSLM